VNWTDSCGPVNQDDPTRDNLLFTGDSLDVLRVLAEHPEFRREFRNKVKCVYIDPPFNTGQAFEHYDDWMEHSTWLSFMRDRLLLIRDLLAQDGTVWVHLDDIEQHRMRCLMDEVFGSNNFVTSIVWQKLYARKSNTRISTSHDTIICYAKDEQYATANMLPATPELLARYKNPDGDFRGPWQSVSFHVRTDNPDRRTEYRYKVTLPSGRQVGPPPGRHWNGKVERYERLLQEGMLWFGPQGDALPRLKMFLKPQEVGLVPNTWWDRSEVEITTKASPKCNGCFRRPPMFFRPLGRNS
jgi:adenine-specific DNA-methyltransferase